MEGGHSQSQKDLKGDLESSDSYPILWETWCQLFFDKFLGACNMFPYVGGICKATSSELEEPFHSGIQMRILFQPSRAIPKAQAKLAKNICAPLCAQIGPQIGLQNIHPDRLNPIYTLIAFVVLGIAWNVVWCGKPNKPYNCPQVITIFMGGMFTIPHHGRFMAAWVSHIRPFLNVTYPRRIRLESTRAAFRWRSWNGGSSKTTGFKSKIYSTGWWFGTFFIFPYIGKNHPNSQLTTIFQRGRYTTNQYSVFCVDDFGGILVSPWKETCREPITSGSCVAPGERLGESPISWVGYERMICRSSKGWSMMFHHEFIIVHIKVGWFEHVGKIKCLVASLYVCCLSVFPTLQPCSERWSKLTVRRSQVPIPVIFLSRCEGRRMYKVWCAKFDAWIGLEQTEQTSSGMTLRDWQVTILHINGGYALCLFNSFYMGVSENSVPLNPIVNDHYPY